MDSNRCCGDIAMDAMLCYVWHPSAVCLNQSTALSGLMDLAVMRFVALSHSFADSLGAAEFWKEQGKGLS